MASRRVAAFCRTEAGAMPARIGKYSVGFGFRDPVIVRKAEFIDTSTSFVFCFLAMLGSSIQQWGTQERGCWSWACSRRHPTLCRPAGLTAHSVTKLSAAQMQDVAWRWATSLQDTLGLVQIRWFYHPLKCLAVVCVKMAQGIHSIFFVTLKPILMVVGVECCQVPIYGVLDVCPVKARAKSSA